MASRQTIAKAELASAIGKQDKFYGDKHDRSAANDFDRLVKDAVTTCTYANLQV